MKPRVLVAMSGGVDSSVAAAILREQDLRRRRRRDAPCAGANRTNREAPRHLLLA